MVRAGLGRNSKVELAVSAVLYGALSGVVGAADAPVEPDGLDEVVVTGSNIRRADLEKIVPITVIDQAAMETRNAVLPADLLTSLPSVVSLPQNESRLGSSGARGDNANVNLRNLGATATLILIDGRRMAINPMTAGLSQAVNINQVPTHGVERIEVLRDGASSIYGSDAVGGVINFVLKRQMEGVEGSVRYNMPETGGGESLQGSLAFGSAFAGGRGRLFGTLSGLNRDEVLLTDHDFSESSLNVDRAPAGFNALAGPFDQRSTRGAYPTFRLGTTGTSGTTYYFAPLGTAAPALTTTNPTTAANRALYPNFLQDNNVFGFASPSVRRGDAFLSAEFDISDGLTVFGDASFYMAKSTMQRQPLAVNGPTTDQPMVMPVDSPYNPFGSRFFSPTGAPNVDGTPRRTGTPQAIALTQFTVPGLAPESVTTESDALRLVAGVRGDIGATWRWEASAFYNEVNGEDNAYPDVRESRLASAIAGTGGTYFNPFGYTFRVDGNAVVADQPYSNPQALVDSFSETYSRTARSSLASAEASANGTLVTLGAIDVQAAFGAGHRLEDLEDVRPPFHGENPADSGLPTTNNDFILHPARPDVLGDREVTSAYAEFVVPLVTRDRAIRFVHTFEISASVRYEHYSDFGDVTKPKFGANWRPVPWLMLRGSYNEGFMAPSLAALYTSPRWSISTAGTNDPYRNGAIGEGAYTMRNYFGGNPDLKAQESVGTTFGFVLDVPGVTGLSLTADYWRIKRSNLLGQRGVNDMLANDAALLRAFSAAQAAAGVPANAINAGAGTADYKGDPDVERFAPDAADLAAFAAYNAANPGSPAAVVGRVFSTDTPFVNFSESEHRGVDLGLTYFLPSQSWGRLGVNAEASYLWRAQSVVPTATTPTVSNDLYSGGAAKWRSTANLTWDQGPWNAGLGVYYISRTHDTPTVSTAVYESLGSPSYIDPFFTNGTTVNRLVIDPVISYNLTVGYQFERGTSRFGDTRVRLGIVNITDEAPPLSANSDGFGYDPAVSQNLLNGRTWSLEVTTRF